MEAIFISCSKTFQFFSFLFLPFFIAFRKKAPKEQNQTVLYYKCWTTLTMRKKNSRQQNANFTYLRLCFTGMRTLFLFSNPYTHIFLSLCKCSKFGLHSNWKLTCITFAHSHREIFMWNSYIEKEILLVSSHKSFKMSTVGMFADSFCYVCVWFEMKCESDWKRSVALWTNAGLHLIFSFFLSHFHYVVCNVYERAQKMMNFVSATTTKMFSKLLLLLQLLTTTTMLLMRMMKRCRSDICVTAYLCNGRKVFFYCYAATHLRIFVYISIDE
jgi:hypothetical protein